MLSGGTREIFSGLMLLIGSGVYLFVALNYRLGSALRMGPGYFPMLLGILGMIVAGAIVVRGVLLNRAAASEGTDTAPNVALRPVVAIAASVIAFGVAITWAGLLVAVASSVIAAALGDRTSTVGGTLGLVVVLCAGSWFIFVVLLGLPVPLVGMTR